MHVAHNIGVLDRKKQKGSNGMGLGELLAGNVASMFPSMTILVLASFDFPVTLVLS